MLIGADGGLQGAAVQTGDARERHGDEVVPLARGAVDLRLQRGGLIGRQARPPRQRRNRIGIDEPQVVTRVSGCGRYRGFR